MKQKCSYVLHAVTLFVFLRYPKYWHFYVFILSHIKPEPAIEDEDQQAWKSWSHDRHSGRIFLRRTLGSTLATHLSSSNKSIRPYRLRAWPSRACASGLRQTYSYENRPFTAAWKAASSAKKKGFAQKLGRLKLWFSSASRLSKLFQWQYNRKTIHQRSTRLGSNGRYW